MIIGMSQYFFLDLKNPHKSFKNSISSPCLVRFYDVIGAKRVVPFLHD
jgi:hypothetical protein